MRSRKPLLNVAALDARDLPSATLLNLTTVDSTATAAGAILDQVDAQPTGTGHIQSFVRLQGAASGGGSQQGYNTTARPLQFDENKSPSFTRGISLSAVPVVEDGGATYYEFLLDINQKSSSSRLSIDEVRIYLGETSGLSGYDSAAKTLAGLTPKFDLDADGDVSVILDARLNSGSGAGDMTLRVPTAAFGGAPGSSFVYLYSRMGQQAGATANGGFEEWAVRKDGGTSTPPPAATASISGRVFNDVGRDGQYNPEGGIDHGFEAVIIQLQGVDDLGQTVVRTTLTAADGTYSFTGLRAGTYSLFEIQPEGCIDGDDFAGSFGGTVDGVDGIIGITISTGGIGVNYDFTEYFDGNS
jgi:hypothetical protein